MGGWPYQALMLQAAPWSKPAVMAHHSIVGSRETTLGWILLVLAILAIVVVTALLAAAIYRRASGTAAKPFQGKDGLRWITIGGVIVPAVVLGAVFVATIITQSAVAAPSGGGHLSIAVVGHRWWWELRYGGSTQAISANEIHIPVGTPVQIQLKAGDVIHSLWIPQLGGKTDLIPGRTNTTWIQADSAGIYRGQCAEFCGTQHARMALTIVAEPGGDFAQWLSRQQEPADPPSAPDPQAGMDVFMHSACAGCHTIRGTPAKGVLGPDLTHLASRHTLAGGSLANNKGNLAGWIGNPQAIKPGSMMPITPLTPAQLLSIVAYLQTLK